MVLVNLLVELIDLGESAGGVNESISEFSFRISKKILLFLAVYDSKYKIDSNSNATPAYKQKISR